MIILNNPSQEELFDLWCDDLIALGYIKQVYKREQLPPFHLFKGLSEKQEVKTTIYKGTSRERVKITEKIIYVLNPVAYTPDRCILWHEKAVNIFTSNDSKTYFRSSVVNGELCSFVEVKAPPGYGSSHTSDAAFRISQKWVYEKFNIIVNKVYNYPNKTVKDVSPYLWLSTFTPTRYFLTDKKLEPRTITRWKPIKIQEFLQKKKPYKK